MPVMDNDLMFVIKNSYMYEVVAIIKHVIYLVYNT